MLGFEWARDLEVTRAARGELEEVDTSLLGGRARGENLRRAGLRGEVAGWVEMQLDGGLGETRQPGPQTR